MKRIGVGAGVLLAGLFFPVAGPAAALQDDGALPEYVVKAGFLFNFAKYVEWPAEAFASGTAPISIGILGSDPFGEELDRILKSKTVKERSFSIVRFREAGDLKQCHILFIARSERTRVADILRQTESWPVLSVGEDEGFARAGGTVNILIQKDVPRLEVNLEAAEKSRLTINSKLLKIATLVKTAK